MLEVSYIASQVMRFCKENNPSGYKILVLQWEGSDFSKDIGISSQQTLCQGAGKLLKARCLLMCPRMGGTLISLSITVRLQITWQFINKS